MNNDDGFILTHLARKNFVHVPGTRLHEQKIFNLLANGPLVLSCLMDTLGTVSGKREIVLSMAIATLALKGKILLTIRGSSGQADTLRFLVEYCNTVAFHEQVIVSLP